MIMEEQYRRDEKIIEMTELEREVELMKAIINTKNNLKDLNTNFEYAKDDLVDYYVYQIKAYQAKLDYLIKLAKTKGLQLDMINEIKIRSYQHEEAS